MRMRHQDNCFRLPSLTNQNREQKTKQVKIKDISKNKQKMKPHFRNVIVKIRLNKHRKLLLATILHFQILKRQKMKTEKS